MLDSYLKYNNDRKSKLIKLVFLFYHFKGDNTVTKQHINFKLIGFSSLK